MLENLIDQYKTIKKEIEDWNKELSSIRLQIINIMEEMNEEKVEYNTGKATLAHPKSFDTLTFKEENPEVYQQYMHTETIEVFNDKQFGMEQPALLNKYMIPQTPRLTIK